MLSEKDIIAQIKQDPQALIPVEWAHLDVKQNSQCPHLLKSDLLLKLSMNNISSRLVAEIISSSSRAIFLNKIEQVKRVANLCHSFPLLIASYFSSSERNLCRDNQVFFMDLSGNQWISVKGILIEREGFKNKYPEAREGRNPFSDKASLIIRELIVNYGKARRVRELADHLELSAGFVSKMAAELDERGYIQRSQKGLLLINPEELIADWVNHYSIRDNRQYRYFLAAISVDEVLKKIRDLELPEAGYAIAAQAGANLVYKHAAHDVVHVYVEDDQMRGNFANSLKLERVERGENIILMKSKYKKSVFYHSRKIQGLNVVSDLQLYLDLYHYPKRGREQAEKIYDLKLLSLIHI